VAALVLLVAALVAGLAFAKGEGKAHATLKQVETKKVCMINNQAFEKDQIPVQVEGKTYYGCCEMCKERLAKDPASRQAVDPVTGKTVDKAKAVIGVLPDGKVLYFESAETLAKYEAPAAE
jgi:YHS domain-containing protein